MTIQLVVFDMAGTTVEDPGAVNGCIREALSAAGLTLDPEAVNRVMGLPKPEAIRWLVKESPRAASLNDRIDEIHADFVARMLAFYRNRPEVREVPGASQVFRALKRAGIKVGLDTGFSRDIAQAILDRLGWVRDGLIDASVTSDEVPRGRPHPDMIQRLMGQLGVTDAGSVAKVGDAPADLEEGTNAGCRAVIGVTWGTHTREELERFPHTHLIDRIEDVLAIVGAGESSPSA